MTDTAVPHLQQLQQHKPLATESRTITDTLVGEHSHHIVGYSLIKGIGDGEPIASERFMVGGHDWVSGWVGGWGGGAPTGEGARGAEAPLCGGCGVPEQAAAAACTVPAWCPAHHAQPCAMWGVGGRGRLCACVLELAPVLCVCPLRARTHARVRSLQQARAHPCAAVPHARAAPHDNPRCPQLLRHASAQHCGQPAPLHAPKALVRTWTPTQAGMQAGRQAGARVHALACMHVCMHTCPHGASLLLPPHLSPRTHTQPQVLLFYPDGKRSSSSDAHMQVRSLVLPAPNCALKSMHHKLPLHSMLA